MTADTSNRWADAWPDALAFAAGLAIAGLEGWNTADLVWSLWLSSLCVGYAMIVWTLTRPLRAVIAGMAAEPAATGAGPKVAVGALLGVGTLFGLAFFTVHFGGFHFVHSVFLNSFFPVSHASGFPGPEVYTEVFARYWFWIPVAAVAERAAFRTPEKDPEADTAVTAEAIAARKARPDALMAPYKNVVRLHLLIFFFAFAHFAKLENLAIYAVVYAVYFFPWRLLRRASARS